MNVKILSDSISLKTDTEGKSELVLSVTKDTTYAIRNAYSEIKQGLTDGKKLAVELKWFSKKRSLDANGACWLLCQAMAEKLGSTKDEIYRASIRDVGRFIFLPIKDTDVEKWIKDWESIGMGWISEAVDVSTLSGYVKTINYKGSSTFDVEEMYNLLKYLVAQAKEMGIVLISDSEVDLLKRDWGK